MIDKSKLLSSLGLKDINQGSSTGYNWLNSNGKTSGVFSPGDGNKISSIVETDESTYEKILDSAKKNVYFMHDLPAHHGEEISDGLLYDSRSIVFKQAENRIWAQIALIDTIFSLNNF